MFDINPRARSSLSPIIKSESVSDDVERFMSDWQKDLFWSWKFGLRRVVLTLLADRLKGSDNSNRLCSHDIKHTTFELYYISLLLSFTITLITKTCLTVGSVLLVVVLG